MKQPRNFCAFWNQLSIAFTSSFPVWPIIMTLLLFFLNIYLYLSVDLFYTSSVLLSCRGFITFKCLVSCASHSFLILIINEGLQTYKKQKKFFPFTSCYCFLWFFFFFVKKKKLFLDWTRILEWFHRNFHKTQKEEFDVNKINLIKNEVNFLLFVAAMVIVLVKGRIFRVRLESMNLGSNPMTHGI